MSEPVIPGGCIFISRKILESEIWEKPPLYMKVWMYLLLRAQHKDFKGLKRGQVSTSIPEIIEAVKWKVGARIERPTKDQVFQVINWMRSTKTQWEGDEAVTKATMITTTKATQSLLVNIDNYWFYQDISNYESNAEDNDEKPTKATRKQRKSDNINKNVKNDKNVEEGKEEEISGTEVPKRKVFIHPTLEEVTTYCYERGNRVNPENWYDHYISNGWKVGKNPMKDWKAAVRTWEKNSVTPSRYYKSKADRDAEEVNALKLRILQGGAEVAATNETRSRVDVTPNQNYVPKLYLEQ